MEKPTVGLIINNRYRLVQYLGQGSFGEVWMAKDTITNLDIAIKLYLSLDARGQEEFLSEYKVAYGLKHPNLVVTEVYDTWESRPFLVMKFCSKGSSSKVIGTLTPNYGDERFIWQFLHDVSAGLAYLHNQTPDPIVHQDIKPDNILVDSDGSFLISDFGISKRIRSTMRAQSTRALKAGATAYMGPERFSKNPAPITASDIWSLGVSVYELAEGELPFAGMGGIFLKNGGDMAELSPGWTVELNNVMQRCLARDTWDRMKAFEIVEHTRNILAKFDVWYASVPKMGDTVQKAVNNNPKGTQYVVNTDNPFANPKDIAGKNKPGQGGNNQPQKPVEQPELPVEQPEMSVELKAEKTKEDKPETPKPEADKPKAQKPAKAKKKGLDKTAAPGALPVEEKEPKGKSRTMIYVAAAVAVVVIAVGAWFIFAGGSKTNEEALMAYNQEYLPTMDNFMKDVDAGDQAQYQELIKANNELAVLDSLENLYRNDMPDEFSRAAALRQQYESKAIPAAKAWAESAKTQVQELENVDRALEYYKVSYAIYNDPEVEKTINELSASK